MRIEICKEGCSEWESFHPVLSLLSYMLKAPLVPNGATIVDALFTQRYASVNVFRACLGLGSDNFMTLEHHFDSMLNDVKGGIEPAEKKTRLVQITGIEFDYISAQCL